MSKLSNGGRLYLADYEILEEVRGEVNFFLDFLIDSLKENLDIEKEKLSTDFFEVYVFSNQSKKGYLELGLLNKKNFKNFKESKVDIKIIYRDIRHTSEMNPNQGHISIYTPQRAADIKRSLSSISTERSGIDIYEDSTIDFNLDNGLETIGIIQEKVLEIYEELLGCVNDLIRNKIEQ